MKTAKDTPERQQLYADMNDFKPVFSRMREVLKGRQAIEAPTYGPSRDTVYFGGYCYDCRNMTDEQIAEVHRAEVEWAAVRRRNPGLLRRIDLFEDMPFTIYEP